MNKADFRRLFAYSDNCWRVLNETIPTVPDAWDAPFETTSRWNSIRMILSHCMAAEERWITFRLQGLPLPVMYEERAAPDWDGLYRDHKTIRAATYAYLDRVSDADVEEEKPVELAQWTYDLRLSLADVLFHMINHENYHRGQVISELQRRGADPPNFDYAFLKPNDFPDA